MKVLLLLVGEENLQVIRWEVDFSNKKNGVLLYLNMVWMNIVCC